MTSWLPETLSPKGPVYVAIADALSRDVASGRLAPGDRLPTHRALAKSLGVNVVTITRAYAEAGRRGLVDGEVGRGTFVRDGAKNELPLLNHGLTVGQTGVIDMHFSVQAVDEGLLDRGELLAELAREPGTPFLSNHYEPGGFAAHREAGAAWLQRSGVDADPERTLITVGAQHGMMVGLSSLTEPGDVVLTEEVAYTGVKALGHLLHLRLQPLQMDEHGIRPDSFADACLRANPKVLYVNPTLHNPTGIVTPAGRREEIAELAARHGVTILEDDTQSYLIEDPPPAFATLAPERTYFLTSLSKSLLGDLRVGYLLAPRVADSDAALHRLRSSIASTVWMGPPIVAEIASRWIQSGKADEVVRWKREQVRRRRAIFDRLMGADASRSHAGSSFVWLPLPADWRADDLVEQARASGVAIASGESFVVGRGASPHAVRICIGSPATEADVERGLGTIARILRRRPQRCATVI